MGTPTNWAMETRREEPVMKQFHSVIRGARAFAGFTIVSIEGPRDGDGPPDETSGDH
jgi:hypothetical protein